MYIYRISNITVSDSVILCGLMICMYVRNMIHMYVHVYKGVGTNLKVEGLKP